MDLINREIYGNYFYYVALSFLQRKIENDYTSKNLRRGKSCLSKLFHYCVKELMSPSIV